MLRSKQSQVNNAMVNRPEIFVNIMSLVDNFHNCHQLVLVSPSTYLFLHKTDYIQKYVKHVRGLERNPLESDYLYQTQLWGLQGVLLKWGMKV